MALLHSSCAAFGQPANQPGQDSCSQHWVSRHPQARRRHHTQPTLAPAADSPARLTVGWSAACTSARCNCTAHVSSASATQSWPGPLNHASHSAAVPVVDISPLASNRTASAHQRTACLAQLRDTAHTAGFLYVTGHGVPQQLLSDAAGAARRVFALPEAAKAVADYHSSAAFRGYMHLGVENTAGRVDEREQFEFGREGPVLPADATVIQPPHFRLHAANQWSPELADGSVAGIKASLMAYLEAMHDLAVLLLEALAESMGLPTDAFLSFQGSGGGSVAHSDAAEPGGLHSGSPAERTTADHSMVPGSEHQASSSQSAAYTNAGTSAANSTTTSSSNSRSGSRARMPPYMTVKALRYPRTTSAAGMGVGAHSDSGLITLLLQDEVGGLQAQLPGSCGWVDVVPMPDTLVVNLGELLQLASGGYLVATVHRVVSRPNQQDRISLPFFYNAPLDAIVLPVPLPPDLQWRRPPPAVQSTTHDGQNQLIAAAGENVMKSFARSHPQVLKRHHPDLWHKQQAGR